METQRQKKIAGVIQKDIVDILQRAAIEGGMRSILISVTKVAVTSDLSLAKVYLSIFPTAEAMKLMEGIKSNQPLIKHELSQRTRNQMRRVPELLFYLDDSLDYIENIEHSLKGGGNPITDPNLLPKRKKS